MRSHKAVGVVAVASAAVLGITACGSETGEPVAASSAKSTSSSTSRTYSSTTTSPEPPADFSKIRFTPGGTKLKYGESATVKLRDSKRVGAIKVTVSKPKTGKVSDLNELDDKSDVKKQVKGLVYVSMTVELLAKPADMRYLDVKVTSVSDETFQSLMLIGTFTACPEDTASFTKAGDKRKQCQTLVSTTNPKPVLRGVAIDVNDASNQYGVKPADAVVWTD